MQALGSMTSAEYCECLGGTNIPGSDLINSPKPAIEVDSEKPVSPPAVSSAKTSNTGSCKKLFSNGAADVGNFRRSITKAGMRTSVLTEEQAIEVFKKRPLRLRRAVLSSELAELYGVTTTAIRHIWDRRTWVWTNLPYWTKAELAASLAEGMCECCRRKKIDTIDKTCANCPINRKRGRPRGSRDTYSRKHKDEF